MGATSEEWKQVSALFHEASALAPQARESWLREATKDKPHLLDEILSLLNAFDEAGDFLEAPAANFSIPKLDQSLGSGATIGDFEIQELLGEGSFGKVYLAQQISLGREVAIKVTPNIGNEARTMAPLEHESIVRVFSENIEAAKGIKILCMQYVPGITLERLLSQTSQSDKNEGGTKLLQMIDRLGPQASLFDPTALKDRERVSELSFIDTTLWWGTRLADALAYAHGKGVLHLDIKPGNVLISCYGRPLLTDFNVSLRHQTETQVLGGTLDYMAPEHKRAFYMAANLDPDPGAPYASEPLGLRADLYSLGLVLKETLTKGGVKLPLPTAKPSFSSEEEDLLVLAQVLNKATSLEASGRYDSAAQFAKALEACLVHRSIKRDLPPAGPFLRWGMKHIHLALWICLVGPQLLGSLINISYNQLRIVSRLSSEGEAAFSLLVVVYNLLVYPLCLTLAYRRFRDLVRFFEVRREPFSCEESELKRLRQRLLALPRSMISVISLGWLPGSIFFPIGIAWLSGPVPLYVYGHFFISFVMSWLIALTYSFLFSQTFVLRGLYPELLRISLTHRKVTQLETKHWGTRLRLFHFLAGFVPLLAATLIVLHGPDSFNSQNLLAFQWLVGLLIGIGMAGFASALKTLSDQAQALYALTSNGGMSRDGAWSQATDDTRK